MASTTSPNEKRNTLGQVATATAEGATDLVSSLGDKAKDAASSVAHTAEDAASYVGRKAEDAASYVGRKAEDATAAVGGRLDSLGHTIRANTPHGGVAGGASSAVANTLETSGRYLQEEGLKGIGKDVTNLIRRNPVPALLIGVGVGLLIGRIMTRRS